MLHPRIRPASRVDGHRHAHLPARAQQQRSDDSGAHSTYWLQLSRKRPTSTGVAAKKRQPSGLPYVLLRPYQHATARDRASQRWSPTGAGKSTLLKPAADDDASTQTLTTPSPRTARCPASRRPTDSRGVTSQPPKARRSDATDEHAVPRLSSSCSLKGVCPRRSVRPPGPSTTACDSAAQLSAHRLIDHRGSNVCQV